ncbi:MAG: hypothetical protein ACXAC5_01260 [Promethearchaeota archaeon]
MEASSSLLAPSIIKPYKRYFDKITELRAGDIIVHAQCKLCNHPLRSEAEAKWEQTKGRSGKGSYAVVIKFLNDKADEYDGVKFNYQNISVHINNHYEQQLKRMRMREYGRHLTEMVEAKINKEEMLEGVIQSLLMTFFEIAANPDIDPVKQADTMTKLEKSIVDASVAQAKLSGDIDTLDVYKEKVQNVIVNFISSEKDTARQRELLQQLDIARAELAENQ